jgi:hypothetical protein
MMDLPLVLEEKTSINFLPNINIFGKITREQPLRETMEQLIVVGEYWSLLMMM